MLFKNPGLSRLKCKISLLLTVLILALVGVVGCSSGDGDNSAQDNAKQTIMFADYNWQSSLFNNRVAQFIIENGYGYKTDSMPGESIPLLQGLQKGDIDVSIETWIQNYQEVYDNGISTGAFVDLGTNFNDSVQGIFVPTYVIKGDPERGIEPMAPDLKSIEDLPKYWGIFKDPEDPGKGRVYGCVPGWGADKVLTEKVETYGITETYNLFRPGSGASLASSLISAYEKGEPWLGYYWGPTWVFGAIDLTQIEESPYSEELWNKGYACAFPSVDVNVVVHKDLPEQAPDVVEFLKNYGVGSKLISEALAYMREKGVEADEAALWFLREKADIWTQWVPDDVAEKVKQKL